MVVHCCDALDHASMGPRSFERGDVAGIAGGVYHSMASMGPRSFERGDPRRSSSKSHAPTGFNGAALFRARRPCEPIRQCAVCLASMGPRSFERGDPPGPRGCRGHHRASMGPRSFERGDMPSATPSTWAPIRFNGAALFRARRQCPRKAIGGGAVGFNGAALFRARRRLLMTCPMEDAAMLQWGRALSSAETMVCNEISSDDVWASMGPRSFERGDMNLSQNP